MLDEVFGPSGSRAGRLVERYWRQCLARRRTRSANCLGLGWCPNHGTLQGWFKDWKEAVGWMPRCSGCLWCLSILFGDRSSLHATLLEGCCAWQYFQLQNLERRKALQPVQTSGLGADWAVWPSADRKRMPWPPYVPDCREWHATWDEAQEQEVCDQQVPKA